jgi:tetratricopeptide (TPR) repeat protein
VVQAAPRIVTADDVTTEPELAARAERALATGRWQDAAQAYDTLLRVSADGPHAPEYLFDLGIALEGMQQRSRARDAFLELARRFPDASQARSALVRAASLDAYLEDWNSLQKIGSELLSRPDLEDVERLLALGARGLAQIELGDDVAASRDVYDALDLADGLHYGKRDVLPVAIAQARFALGELRRVRSERIRFEPLPADFLDELDARCAGLLQAQAAYAEAVRSVDPHWAAMAGYRVGEMYRQLHRELTAIPAPPTATTEHQKQAFFAFMHVRYRVLLEKGLREIEQTIALGERTSDSSPWIQRAREAKEEMQTALSGERAQLEAMPFSEADVKAALDQLEKKLRTSSATATRRGPAR